MRGLPIQTPQKAIVSATPTTIGNPSTLAEDEALMIAAAIHKKLQKVDLPSGQSYPIFMYASLVIKPF